MAGLFLFSAFVISDWPGPHSTRLIFINRCRPVTSSVSTYQSTSTHTNSEPPRAPLKTASEFDSFFRGNFPTLAMPDTSVGNSLAIFLFIWLFRLQPAPIFQWNFLHSFRIGQEGKYPDHRTLFRIGTVPKTFNHVMAEAPPVSGLALPESAAK